MVNHGNTVHGHADSKHTSSEYVIWGGIVQRTENANNKMYKYYGAKGVRMCRRWRESFQAFLADVGRRPSTKHSLGRYCDLTDYSPEGCAWMPNADQSLAKKNKGALLKWAKETGRL